MSLVMVPLKKKTLQQCVPFLQAELSDLEMVWKHVIEVAKENII
jgi:hypothetical protein